MQSIAVATVAKCFTAQSELSKKRRAKSYNFISLQQNTSMAGLRTHFTIAPSPLCDDCIVLGKEFSVG
eukprot:5934457-Amphidinium_carterae.1